MGWKDRIQPDVTPTKTSSWRDRIVQEPEVQEEPSLLSQLGQATLSTAQAVPVGVAKGITAGALEEGVGGIVGGIEAARSKLAEYIPALETSEEEVNRQLREKGFTGDLPTAGEKSILQQYQEARDAAKQYTGQLSKESPIPFLGSEVAGGVVPLVATGGGSVIPTAASTAKNIGLGTKALNLGKTVGKGAATGAGYGAITGLTEGEGDLTKGEVGKVLEDIGEGTKTGAVFGGALSTVAPALEGGKTFKELVDSIRNRNPTINKFARTFEKKVEGEPQFFGGTQFTQQGDDSLDLIKELASVVGKKESNIGKKIDSLVEMSDKGIDITKEKQNLISEFKEFAKKATSKEGEDEALRVANKIDNYLTKRTNVVQSGEDIALKEAEKTKARLISDSRRKQELLDKQNLQEQQTQKAADIAELKRLRKLEDAKIKAETFQESNIPHLGQVREMPETQRQIVQDFSSGKITTTPIKQVVQKEIPEFTETISEPEFNRAIFQDKKTGDIISTPFGKDITEEVVVPKTEQLTELLRQKRDIGSGFETVQTGEGRKVTSKAYNLLDTKIQEALPKASQEEYKNLNTNYSIIKTAMDVVNDNLTSLDKVKKEKASQAIAGVIDNIGDIQNLQANRVVRRLFSELEKVMPDEIAPIKEKIIRNAENLELNADYLGVSPSRTGRGENIILGTLLKGGYRTAEVAGIGTREAKKLISPITTRINQLTNASANDLATRAEQAARKGNSSLANFYKNLSTVTSEGKKKALLFSASQNPNLRDAFSDEEETP